MGLYPGGHGVFVLAVTMHSSVEWPCSLVPSVRSTDVNMLRIKQTNVCWSTKQCAYVVVQHPTPRMGRAVVTHSGQELNRGPPGFPASEG